jgi:AcrR family transcriptional regulator
MQRPESIKGEARQLILNAAEILFAEHGVEAVSLRTINSKAGVSAGVLHYHFGSREVLVSELITRHMGELTAQRERLLNELQPAQAGVRDLMRIVIEPLASLALAGGDEGRRYVRMIARLYADRSPILEEVSRRYLHVSARYPQLLHQFLPEQDPAILDIKFEMANHAMLQMLADLTRESRPWLERDLERMDKQAVVELLVDFTSSGICGSISNKKLE